jgi:CDP-diacylglycerol--glycerol-3-phosphate 3-phosphatidyltransferase
VLIAVVAGYALESAAERPWIPFIAYAVAAAADGLDGYVARRTGSVSLLGGILDVEYDALGILVAVLYCLRAGVLPWVFLVVGLLRYAYVASLWVMRRRGRELGELTPSVLRRRVAGVQMGVLAFCMIPAVDRGMATAAEAVVGTALTAGFVRDWLVVARIVDHRSRPYRLLRLRAKRLLTRWLPVVLRVLLGAAWVALVVSDASRGGMVAEILRGLLVLGLLPRRTAAYAALGLAVATAAIWLRNADASDSAVVATALAVYLLGPGSLVDLRPQRRRA